MPSVRSRNLTFPLIVEDVLCLVMQLQTAWEWFSIAETCSWVWILINRCCVTVNYLCLDINWSHIELKYYGLLCLLYTNLNRALPVRVVSISCKPSLTLFRIMYVTLNDIILTGPWTKRQRFFYWLIDWLIDSQSVHYRFHRLRRFKWQHDMTWHDNMTWLGRTWNEAVAACFKVCA